MKPYLLAAAVVFLLWLGVKSHLKADGRQEAISAALVHRNAILEDSIGHVDTVYAVNTTLLATWRRKYAMLKAATVAVHAGGDTVRPPTMPEVIAVADSTIYACSQALQTCEQRVSLRDQRIGVLDSLWKNERKHARGARFLGIPVGCTVGGAVTPKGFGPGVSCGVRF